MLPSDNHILANIPNHELARLINGEEGGLEKTFLARDAVLCRAGETFNHVYFPVTNVISALAVLDDQRTVACSLTGREGMIGGSLLDRSKVSPMRFVQSVSGDCYRIPSVLLSNLLPDCPKMQASLGLWQETISWLAMRTAVCHKHHTVEQRMCRWLLELADRCNNEEFVITQTVLAEMLGAHRQQISRIAAHLQRAGIIQYLNGDMEILKRPKLETLACECYRISQEIYRSNMHEKP